MYMYMNIGKWEDDYFHLYKSPGVKSYTLFIAILSLAFGASYYGRDSVYFKSIYIIGAFILGLTFFDEWEDFIVDRCKNIIFIRRMTTLQKLLCRNEIRRIHFPMSDVIAIRINQDQIQSHITLILRSGLQVAISETPTNANTSHIEALVIKMQSFFKLTKIESINPDLCNSIFLNENEYSTSDSEQENVTSLH